LVKDRSCSSLKRFEEAREYYERATKADPNFALAYTDWGIALANLGRHKEAIEKYKKAGDSDPKYTRAYREWALALERLGKMEKPRRRRKSLTDWTVSNSFFPAAGFACEVGPQIPIRLRFAKTGFL
jgi:tetratricopeptide (TPR) repeat protein